jgi:hypothetical protein
MPQLNWLKPGSERQKVKTTSRVPKSVFFIKISLGVKVEQDVNTFFNALFYVSILKCVFFCFLTFPEAHCCP